MHLLYVFSLYTNICVAISVCVRPVYFKYLLCIVAIEKVIIIAWTVTSSDDSLQHYTISSNIF